MAIDERARHELHEAARRALGTEAGDTLMTLLPPVGWGDVATKADLDELQQSFQKDLLVLGAQLRTEMAVGQRRLVIQLVTAMIALNGVLTGLVAALA